MPVALGLRHGLSNTCRDVAVDKVTDSTRKFPPGRMLVRDP